MPNRFNFRQSGSSDPYRKDAAVFETVLETRYVDPKTLKNDLIQLSGINRLA